MRYITPHGPYTLSYVRQAVKKSAYTATAGAASRAYANGSGAKIQVWCWNEEHDQPDIAWFEVCAPFPQGRCIWPPCDRPAWMRGQRITQLGF